MTGGVIVAANQSKNDTAFSFRRTLADTSKPNRIIGIRESSGGLYLLEMDVAENQQNLQIGIYNLLGKKYWMYIKALNILENQNYLT